jgi:hypothetical protein
LSSLASRAGCSGGRLIGAGVTRIKRDKVATVLAELAAEDNADVREDIRPQR